MLSRADSLLRIGWRQMPDRFNFEWNKITFTVTPEEPDAAESIVKIEGCLGRLPYTAQDAAARNSALRLADLSPDNLPGRLRIDKDSRVYLVMRSEPIRADGLAGLLKEVTCMVLKAGERLKQLRGLLVD